MLATETRNLSPNASALHMIDCVSDNHFINHPLLGSLDEIAMVKPAYRPQVSKSFKVSGKCISESYFETSYDEEDIDFLNNFGRSHKNGVILIMTAEMSEFEINYFTEHMRDKLKFIIYYNGDASQFRLAPSRGLTFIRTFSLKAAVIEAYKNAKNGQAIIFPKVDSNFDLFEYIENLN
jgi:hypothetical protein